MGRALAYESLVVAYNEVGGDDEEEEVVEIGPDGPNSAASTMPRQSTVSRNSQGSRDFGEEGYRWEDIITPRSSYANPSLGRTGGNNTSLPRRSFDDSLYSDSPYNSMRRKSKSSVDAPPRRSLDSNVDPGTGDGMAATIDSPRNKGKSLVSPAASRRTSRTSEGGLMTNRADLESLFTPEPSPAHQAEREGQAQGRRTAASTSQSRPARPPSLSSSSNLRQKPLTHLLTGSLARNAPEVRVLYDYTPVRNNELRLQKGDMVALVELFDNGMAYGLNRATGEVGLFSLTAVSRLDEGARVGGLSGSTAGAAAGRGRGRGGLRVDTAQTTTSTSTTSSSSSSSRLDAGAREGGSTTPVKYLRGKNPSSPNVFTFEDDTLPVPRA
ncbi:hypothetical protein HK102_003877 [Quaeritorhiza haematococci]|nr:hypothetical protein HK102_003877 [Quaeritorhiza haematococci]